MMAKTKRFAEPEIVFKEGIAFSFGGQINETLPKAENISEVIVQTTMGAISGGSSGSLIANTGVESITIRINGKEAIKYDGLSGIAGQISMGIAVLREFYYQMHGVAMVDETYIIELPDAIPKVNDVQIIVKLAQNIASIQTAGGDRDTLAASVVAIKYKARDKLPGRVVVPYIDYTVYSHAARTGKLPEYVPTLTVPLRKLIFIFSDGTTLANDTYDRLTLQVGNKNLWDGSIADLRRQQGQKSRRALNTGFGMISFPAGIAVPANTLKLDFQAGTAGTAKNVHLHWIAY